MEVQTLAINITNPQGAAALEARLLNLEQEIQKGITDLSYNGHDYKSLVACKLISLSVQSSRRIRLRATSKTGAPQNLGPFTWDFGLFRIVFSSRGIRILPVRRGARKYSEGGEN